MIVWGDVQFDTKWTILANSLNLLVEVGLYRADKHHLAKQC